MLAEAVQTGAEPRQAAHLRRCVSIGDVSIGLSSRSQSQLCLPSGLASFEAYLPQCDIEITIAEGRCLQPVAGKLRFDSGAVWKLYEAGEELIFDFVSPVLGSNPYKRLHVDRQFSQARLTFHSGYSSAASFPYAFEYPLDELLVTNYLATGRGVEVHGCGLVDVESGPYLFLGHSGAGKSTTARLWSATRHVRILSDDRIVLRPDPDAIWMHGTPWHGEAGFAAAEKAPLNAIFILGHGSRNEFVALSSAQAVAELFARAFVPFHNPAAIDSTLAILQRIVESVPCYQFRFRPDSSAIENILHFHG